MKFQDYPHSKAVLEAAPVAGISTMMVMGVSLTTWALVLNIVYVGFLIIKSLYGAWEWWHGRRCKKTRGDSPRDCEGN